LTEVLELRLLGPFQINGATPAIPQRAKGLIAYLAMHAGRSVSREALASLLWSYSASQQARQSLRQCLTDVRAALGPAKDSLEATRAAIRFTQSANTDIDIRRFEALAQSAEPDDLAAACELYRGEFLEGLEFNSEPFSEWLTIERSRLASVACDVLRRLALLRTQAGDTARAITAAQRLLSLDPLREDAHRILMESYAAEGRRSDALRQFGSCSEIMRRELGVEPDRETLALAERIKTQSVVAPASSDTEGPGPVRPAIAGAPSVSPEPALSEIAGAGIAKHDTRHIGVLGKPPAAREILWSGLPGKEARRWLLWGGLGAIAGALCLAVLGGVLAGHSDHRLLSEDGPSIVVMPFRALGDKGQTELGESIADGLGGQLSQLPGAQIVSSETARTYLLKSLDARQTRRELGVAYIVEGTVASAQPGLHAEATLINTLNDTVVRPLRVDVAETDLGPARDNVVTGLIWPLISVIVEEEGRRAAQKPAAAQTANDLVLLAWSKINRNLPFNNAVEALSLLEKARRIDKKNVDAIALMANLLIIEAQNRTGDYQSKLSAADALLTEALIIQQSQRNVLVRLDRCLLRRAQARYEEALGFCRTLVDDLYRRPLAYKEMGMDYLYLGKPDQAISAFTTAEHLVKRAGVHWTWLIGGGWAYLQVGNYAEAIEWLRRALAQRPRTYSARVWLIAAYALSGREQDAATELAELQRVHPELFSRDDALAQMINDPGSPAFGEHMRLVIEGLEKAGFPERMTKPLLAKTLLAVYQPNSAEGNASH
jgi:DNA-binding SARP family transcriptional activator/TolB-like protein